MSGFYLEFLRGAEPGQAERRVPGAVSDELRAFPHDRYAEVSSAGSVAAQAQRFFTFRDQACKLPLRVGYPDVGLVLVGHLRLDETTALADRLGLQPQTSDPELVASAFRRWGPDVGSSLLGDFAFAVVNEQAQTLTVVRDHLGIRPLYFVELPERVLVADDVSILLAHPSVRSTHDQKVVAEFLLNGRVWNRHDTFFEQIKKVPPATRITWDRDRREVEPYWDPPSRSPEARPMAVEDLGSLLMESVLCRTDSTFPAAAHNSGGWDSGPIAVVSGRAARRGGHSFRTYNWDMSEGGESRPECEHARMIAEREHFCHQEVGLSAEAVAHQLKTHDVTTQGTTAFEYELQVLADARKHDVRQIISGFGGDEFISNRRGEASSNLMRQGRWLAASRALRLESRSGSTWLRRRLLLRLLQAVLRAWVRPELVRIYAAEAAYRAEVLQLLTPEAATHLAPLVPLASKDAAAIHGPSASVRSRQLGFLNSGYHQERCESWASMGRRNGVRYLYPLLDVRVVSSALRMPGDAFRPEGRSRGLYIAAWRAADSSLDPFLVKGPEHHRVHRAVKAIEAGLRRGLPDITDDTFSETAVEAAIMRLTSALETDSTPVASALAVRNAALWACRRVPDQTGG